MTSVNEVLLCSLPAPYQKNSFLCCYIPFNVHLETNVVLNLHNPRATDKLLCQLVKYTHWFFFTIKLGIWKFQLGVNCVNTHWFFLIGYFNSRYLRCILTQKLNSVYHLPTTLKLSNMLYCLKVKCGEKIIY